MGVEGRARAGEGEHFHVALGGALGPGEGRVGGGGVQQLAVLGQDVAAVLQLVGVGAAVGAHEGHAFLHRGHRPFVGGHEDGIVVGVVLQQAGQGGVDAQLLAGGGSFAAVRAGRAGPAAGVGGAGHRDGHGDVALHGGDVVGAHVQRHQDAPHAHLAGALHRLAVHRQGLGRVGGADEVDVLGVHRGPGGRGDDGKGGGHVLGQHVGQFLAAHKAQSHGGVGAVRQQAAQLAQHHASAFLQLPRRRQQRRVAVFAQQRRGLAALGQAHVGQQGLLRLHLFPALGGLGFGLGLRRVQSGGAGLVQAVEGELVVLRSLFQPLRQGRAGGQRLAAVIGGDEGHLHVPLLGLLHQIVHRVELGEEAVVFGHSPGGGHRQVLSLHPEEHLVRVVVHPAGEQHRVGTQVRRLVQRALQIGLLLLGGAGGGEVAAPVGGQHHRLHVLGGAHVRRAQRADAPHQQHQQPDEGRQGGQRGHRQHCRQRPPPSVFRLHQELPLLSRRGANGVDIQNHYNTNPCRLV